MDLYMSVLLLVQVQDWRTDREHLAPVIRRAARSTQQRGTCTVLLVWKGTLSRYRAREFDELQHMLSDIYALTQRSEPGAGVSNILGPRVQVVLYPFCGYNMAVYDGVKADWEALCVAQGRKSSGKKHAHINLAEEPLLHAFHHVRRQQGDVATIAIPVSIYPGGSGGPERPDASFRPLVSFEEASIAPVIDYPRGEAFPVVAVGGTFDHLHSGHRILLTMTAWIASRRVVCAVTGEEMLRNKRYAQYLEPLHTRQAKVAEFLGMTRSNIDVDIVTLTDVYGPTAWDPEISALVISEETRDGAEKIATLRRERGLPPLQVFVIDCLASSDSEGSNGSQPTSAGSGSLSSLELRISSTRIREALSTQA